MQHNVAKVDGLGGVPLHTSFHFLEVKNWQFMVESGQQTCDLAGISMKIFSCSCNSLFLVHHLLLPSSSPQLPLTHLIDVCYFCYLIVPGAI